jgi:hypothetical protein
MSGPAENRDDWAWKALRRYWELHDGRMVQSNSGPPVPAPKREQPPAERDGESAGEDDDDARE